MSKEFKSGDKVTWSSGSGESEGTVKEKITSDKTVEGNQVKASKESPRYLVKNDETGTVTGHKPETLSAKKSSSSSSSSDEFSEGDKVKWNTAQGKTKGTVKKKLTEPISIKDFDVKASEDDPKYLVESDKTGSKAAHKPSALEDA